MHPLLRGASLATLAWALAGCATPASDAEGFSRARLPSPAADEVVIVVFRQMTPPTMGSVTLQVGATSKAELPNNAYTVIVAKAGQMPITVTYPAMTVIKPIKLERSFAGGTTHFLEIVGGLGKISMPGPYVEVWRDLAERNADDGARVLEKCCRGVQAVQP